MKLGFTVAIVFTSLILAGCGTVAQFAGKPTVGSESVREACRVYASNYVTTHPIEKGWRDHEYLRQYRNCVTERTA